MAGELSIDGCIDALLPASYLVQVNHVKGTWAQPAMQLAAGRAADLEESKDQEAD